MLKSNYKSNCEKITDSVRWWKILEIEFLNK